MPSYGLKIITEDNKALFTGDTMFVPAVLSPFLC
jgi:glyoxylase-like metal-dependent hydrolase (beta-lactamase superfamily II)